jgi:O-glycosyl hydrolase
VESSGGKEVLHVVAKNPGGDYVAVLTNTAAQPKSAVLTVGGAAVKVDLAADSVTTLAWK